MEEKTKLSQSRLQSQIKLLGDQAFWIMFGVVGFLLLLATIYILALS
jgi:hypothetical protein